MSFAFLEIGEGDRLSHSFQQITPAIFTISGRIMKRVFVFASASLHRLIGHHRRVKVAWYMLLILQSSKGCPSCIYSSLLLKWASFMRDMSKVNWSVTLWLCKILEFERYATRISKSSRPLAPRSMFKQLNFYINVIKVTSIHQRIIIQIMDLTQNFI